MLFGIDLGGSKIEVAVIDEQGDFVYRQRTETMADDYDAIIRQIDELIYSAQRASVPASCVGICTPGAISPFNSLLKNSNTVCLNGKPFQRDLEQVLGCKVKMANDADCFALSEAHSGAAFGGKSVFGVILGTGVGGGIVIDGKPLSGPNAIAGEWGHNPLPWLKDEELPLRDCYCGKQGCIETFLSGPAMERDHHELTSQMLDVQSIVKHAGEGNRHCDETLRRYEDRLARALASVINVLDPEIIVLGGGLSNISRLYKNVPKIWGRYVFSDRVVTRLVPPKYGDSSGVRGAAWLNSGS